MNLVSLIAKIAALEFFDSSVLEHIIHLQSKRIDIIFLQISPQSRQ